MLQKTKSLLTKCLAFLFIVCCVVASTVGLVACSNTVSVAGVTIKDGKLIVSYTGDKADDSFDVVTSVKPDCAHTETKDVEYDVVGCNHKYFVICSDCGAFVDVKSVPVHTWSEKPDTYERTSCMVGPYTAIYCTVPGCGAIKEDTIVHTEDALGGWLTDHKTEKDGSNHIKKVTFLVDKDGKIVGGDGVYECEYKRVETEICEACRAEVEGKRTTVHEKGKHAWGDWSVVKAPAAGQTAGKGELKHICSECNKTETLTIDSLYAPLKDKDGNDTAEDSATVRTIYGTPVKTDGASCKGDGRKDTYEFKITKAGNIEDEGQTISFAVTVKEPGTNVHYVKVNDQKVYIKTGEGEVNSYMGTVTETDGNKVTCKEAVKAYITCQECETLIGCLVKKDHVEYTEDMKKSNEIAPTCNAEGSFDYICTGCGETQTKSVAKVAHSYVSTENSDGKSVVENKDGTTTFYVTCKYKDCAGLNDNGGKIIGINAVKFVATPKEATCTEKAATVYTDIEIDEKGTKLVDSEGKAVEIKNESGDPKGHADKVEAKEKYDYDELTKGKIGFVNGNKKEDLTCAAYDKTTAGMEVLYTCPDCNGTLTIYVYKNHEAKEVGSDAVTWKDKAPDCENGAVQKVDCKNCTKTEFDVPALGHIWQYTVDTETVEGNTVVKIASAKCVRDGCNATNASEKHTGMVAIGTEVTDYVAANCKNEGSGKVAVKEEGKDVTKTIVISKIAEHTFNGSVVGSSFKIDDFSKVKIVKTATGKGELQMINDIEEITCQAPAINNVLYVCDVCGNNITASVTTEHTGPETIATPATCEGKGTKTVSCKWNCGYTDDIEIPATGHNVTYSVVVKDFKATVTLKCSTCGDKFNTSEDATDEEKSTRTHVIDMTSWFDSANGETAVTNAVGANYTVTETTPGTCAKDGVYTVVLKSTTSKEADDWDWSIFDFGDSGFTFDVTYRADHDTSGNYTYWIEDGKKVEGYWCGGCHNVIPGVAPSTDAE